MQKPLTLLLAIFVIGTALTFAEDANDEIPVISRVESVALFKNGLVAVKETIPIAGEGRYLLERVPQAVLGTLFLESDFPVETTVTTRTVESSPAETIGAEYWKQLLGKDVTIHTQDDTKYEGQLVYLGFDLPKSDGVNSLLANPADALPRNYYPSPIIAASMPRQFLILRNNPEARYTNPPPNMEGTVFIDLSLVASIEAKRDNSVKPVKTVPVMIFDVGTNDAVTSGGSISLFYLTKGMTWSPSYRIDITDPKTLTIEQNAVIANEWASLADAEISLISGFPRIEFENTLSLMTPNTTLLSFFNQLANVGRSRSGSPIMAQQAIMTNMASNAYMPMPEVNSQQLSANEGPDTYYHPIGRKTLERDARLSLSVAKGTADYERSMECTIPIFANVEQSRNNPQDAPFKKGEVSEVWEVLRFNNPFDFPMTTAPASVSANGRFLGQNSSFWTASGAELTVPITRAMSVQVISDEEEHEGSIEPWEVTNPSGTVVQNTENRPTLYRFGSAGTSYRKQVIDATLTVKNLRSEEMKIAVTRQIMGENLVPSEYAPEIKILVDRVSSNVNRTHELKWELTLEPGETRKIEYSYERFVRY